MEICGGLVAWLGFDLFPFRRRSFQYLLLAAPCSAVISLWARPSLLNQKRQVVYPIVLTYPARIDNVRKIIFGVRDNKIGVRI
jgi:hypothetical protein